MEMLNIIHVIKSREEDKNTIYTDGYLRYEIHHIKKYLEDYLGLGLSSFEMKKDIFYEEDNFFTGNYDEICFLRRSKWSHVSDEQICALTKKLVSLDETVIKYLQYWKDIEHIIKS